MLFKRLKSEFEELEDSVPTTFWVCPADLRKDLGKQALDWATAQMEKEWPRNDYRELIELIAVYLSGNATVRRRRKAGPIDVEFKMQKPGLEIFLDANTLIITILSFLPYWVDKQQQEKYDCACSHIRLILNHIYTA